MNEYGLLIVILFIALYFLITREVRYIWDKFNDAFRRLNKIKRPLQIILFFEAAYLLWKIVGNIINQSKSINLDFFIVFLTSVVIFGYFLAEEFYKRKDFHGVCMSIFFPIILSVFMGFRFVKLH